MASQSSPNADLMQGGLVRQRMFFAGISLAMLGVVLVGFGPTFYLRPFFADNPHNQPETWIVFVHGGFMTAWFLILLMQSLLVANGRVAMHRRLGIVGISIAVICVVLNLTAMIQFVPRMADANNLAIVPGIVWGDIATLLVFIPCVALGAIYRTRSELHKRLMILAGISMLSQPLSRFQWWWPSLESLALNYYGVIAFALALAVYDLIQRGRVQRATLIGGVSLAALLQISTIVATSQPGVSFIDFLA